LYSEKTIFKLFIIEIDEYQLPLDLVFLTMVTALRCKHNADLKLRKTPSVYKTPPFDGEILLEFDISTFQRLKNRYSFAQADELLRKFTRATSHC